MPYFISADRERERERERELTVLLIRLHYYMKNFCNFDWLRAWYFSLI